MPEDDQLEPSDDLHLRDLLREVERMRALGRAFTLCVSDEQRRELSVNSRMAAAESRGAAAMRTSALTR